MSNDPGTIKYKRVPRVVFSIGLLFRPTIGSQTPYSESITIG